MFVFFLQAHCKMIIHMVIFGVDMYLYVQLVLWESYCNIILLAFGPNMGMIKLIEDDKYLKVYIPGTTQVFKQGDVGTRNSV